MGANASWSEEESKVRGRGRVEWSVGVEQR